MGRYAQRRRRGGSPPTAAAAVNIIEATINDPERCTLTFDQPVTDNGSGVDANIDIDGIPFDNTGSVGPNQIQVFASGATWAPVTSTLNATGQPTWLDQSLAVPLSLQTD